ncbi:MAG: hypothetical protein JRM85_05000 [Nitrososphaerota archaeon]|nr:hypothetical protein [Nitrososphaerota archaeon]
MVSGINLDGARESRTVRELESFLDRAGLDRAEANRVIMRAIAERAITISQGGGEFEDSEIIFDPNMFSTLIEEPGKQVAETVSASQSPSNSSIVWTVPTRLIPQSSQVSRLSTEAVFKQLLLDSKTEVLIVSPFLEREGIYTLRSEFLAASQRGVRFRLLTRSVDDYNLAYPLNDLFQILGSQLDAKSFHSHVQLKGDAWKQIESTHAKLLLVDGRQMYIGSAELRLNALFSNFELGLLVKDRFLTKQAADLFDIFWNDKLYTKSITQSIVQRVLSRSVR